MNHTNPNLIVEKHLESDCSFMERLIFFESIHRIQPHLGITDRLRVIYLKNLSHNWPRHRFEEFLEECFYKGDTHCARATLLALPHLKWPESYVAYAAAGLRTNIIEIFTALAHNNIFPARFFREDAFNQMVLKNLFWNLPCTPILGLKQRLTPNLIRMVGDYKDELLSAKRSLPKDIHHFLDSPP